MNREARIILPRLDNNGESLDQVHAALRRRLCNLFGGYTRTESFGGWVHEGELFEEAGYAYDVAVEDDIKTRANLRATAIVIGVEARQLAVYVRYPDGSVEIVDTSVTEVPA